MVLYATVFDTNTYLSVPADVFNQIIGEEIQANIIPYVDPWVAMELVAHLADPTDKQHRPARAAITRIVEHAKSIADRPLSDAILVDAEEQVALLLFGKRLLPLCTTCL